MNDLMSKLALSKKIMDKHNEIPRAGADNVVRNSSPQVESFNPVSSTYNIPQEFVNEEIKSTLKDGVPTQDRIINSKLPDEIKKLMIENPIEKPNVPGMGGSFLSEEVIQGAQKLMGTNQKQQSQPQTQNFSGVDMNSLKQMIRDTVRDTVRDVVREELSKSGMLTESESKSNDSLQMRVGKHVFEGKITKIKKVQ
jgi:hypothetical protein